MKVVKLYFNEEVKVGGYTGIVCSIQLKIEFGTANRRPSRLFGGEFLWETLGWRRMSGSWDICSTSTLGNSVIYILS